MIFHVHVDAFGVALGSILAQPEGKMDFPVYFASQRFSKAEQGYSTTEREALGMVFSVQKFRHWKAILFLCGSSSTAVSNQQGTNTGQVDEMDVVPLGI